MSVPSKGSTLKINGVWYAVTKSPAEGFWIEPEKDQWTLLVFVDGKWYVYVPTGFMSENINEDYYVNVIKSYYPGDLFNINGLEYLVSEQLTGFHINFGEPNYIVFDNSVFMATDEVEVKQDQEKRSSNLSGLPEQVLLENMDLEEAKIYCHNFPSDNCNQILVKKIFGSDVINRRPKNMEVKEWLNTLLKFDPTSVKDIILEFYERILNINEYQNRYQNRYQNQYVFMVLIDWYLVNKLNSNNVFEFNKLKRTLNDAINQLILKGKPEFFRWLVDKKLNPKEFNVQSLLELYLKGENQEEILKTFEYFFNKNISMDIPLFWNIGLNEIPYDEVDPEVKNFDLKLLNFFDRFHLFDRYKNLDKLTEELAGLLQYKKFTELDFLVEKGYLFTDKFYSNFDDHSKNTIKNFYEWVNSRNFKLSDKAKRLVIQNAIKIENKEEAIKLLEFVKSQELPENMVVYNISSYSNPLTWQKNLYIPEGIVKDWFIQNGITLDPKTIQT